MIRENQQLVSDEPVEFEKQPVEVQDCRRITDHFRGIYRIYPNLIKENRRISTCNRLDLQTLGSQPVVMPKNLSPRSLIELVKNLASDSRSDRLHVDNLTSSGSAFIHVRYILL